MVVVRILPRNRRRVAGPCDPLDTEGAPLWRGPPWVLGGPLGSAGGCVGGAPWPGGPPSDAQVRAGRGAPKDLLLVIGAAT